MITFPFNLFYPKAHRQDVIYHNGIEIHYQIVSKTDNSNWGVLVTTSSRETGQVIPRQDLVKCDLKTFGDALGYVQSLPKLIDNDDVKTAHFDTMKDELKRIKSIAQKLQLMIDEFSIKYCGE